MVVNKELETLTLDKEREAKKAEEDLKMVDRVKKAESKIKEAKRERFFMTPLGKTVMGFGNVGRVAGRAGSRAAQGAFKGAGKVGVSLVEAQARGQKRMPASTGRRKAKRSRSSGGDDFDFVPNLGL